jgi:hypothetical protein
VFATIGKVSAAVKWYHTDRARLPLPHGGVGSSASVVAPLVSALSTNGREPITVAPTQSSPAASTNLGCPSEMASAIASMLVFPTQAARFFIPTSPVCEFPATGAPLTKPSHTRLKADAERNRG